MNNLFLAIAKQYGYRNEVNRTVSAGILIFVMPLWFLCSLFMYSYLQGQALSNFVLKFEMIQIAFVLLIGFPLMLRRVTVFYFVKLLFFLNLAVLFFAKVGEDAFAHIYTIPTDTLNLPYPDNWIVFAVCLLPLPFVYYTITYCTDKRIWREQAMLPYFIDLKNRYFVGDSAGIRDKITRKQFDVITKKYEDLRKNEHDQNDNILQKFLRKIAPYVLFVLCAFSAGAQIYPFVLSGNVKNSVMLTGMVLLGSGAFSMAVYFFKRMLFIHHLQNELDVTLRTVDRIPNFNSEIEDPKPPKKLKEYA